jgi:hypothetical protein
MIDSNIAVWLGVIGVLEAGAAGLFFSQIFNVKFATMKPLLKLGLLLFAFGIVVQLIRSFHFFNFGAYPADKYVPLWALKDVGGSLILYHFCFNRNL